MKFFYILVEKIVQYFIDICYEEAEARDVEEDEPYEEIDIKYVTEV